MPQTHLNPDTKKNTQAHSSRSKPDLAFAGKELEVETEG